jgi:hypothetical protein
MAAGTEKRSVTHRVQGTTTRFMNVPNDAGKFGRHQEANAGVNHPSSSEWAIDYLCEQAVGTD